MWRVRHQCRGVSYPLSKSTSPERMSRLMAEPVRRQTFYMIGTGGADGGVSINTSHDDSCKHDERRPYGKNIFEYQVCP